MYKFLLNNQSDLLKRCREKVALRTPRSASREQLAKGVPLFLDQLIRVLRSEEPGGLESSLRISGPSGGDSARSEMGLSASMHGSVLLELGYTVDQVVHDYGDLCQAITDLAVERDAPFSIDEFRTLNRCLDNAIADAVTGFVEQRDAAIANQTSADESQRLGFLVHELRNYLQTATLAFTALESGKLAIGGSTSGLLKRSLAGMGGLLTQATAEVRSSIYEFATTTFPVAMLIGEASVAGALQASIRRCTLRVEAVDQRLAISGHREALAAALTNILQNAFKFTEPYTEVRLAAYAVDAHVLIEVQDHCGGLPPGAEKKLFEPFAQAAADKTGLGLGLTIARQNVQASGGRLTVRDLPGTGCVFTIELPRKGLP